MSARTARDQALPRGMIIAILLLTVVVLGLGGAVVAVKLRPESVPSGGVEREVVLWERAVEENPESSDARTGLGLALLSAGRSTEARVAFEEAIELDEENWAALLQLGLLVQEADVERAEDLMARSVRVAPASEKAAPAVAWGDLLLERGDIKAAKKAYRVAIVDAPYVIEAHVGMAKVFEALDDEAAALAEYRYAEQFSPGDPAITAEIERLEAATGE